MTPNKELHVPRVPQVHFRLWNQLDATKFLLDDRANPARAMAADVIKAQVELLGGQTASMLEIGPGPGFDYGDHFQHIPRLRYTGLEGSSMMLRHCKEQHPNADFQRGDFTTLQQYSAQSFDITYAKAIFEHQEDFEVPLHLMLSVTKRLAVVNWYLPPGPVEELRYIAAEPMYYNRYAAADVRAAVLTAGFELEIVTAPPPGNELYICRRRSTRRRTRR